MSSNEEALKKDLEILKMMRQVLGSVIRDLTPEPGQHHPLSDHTIANIKDCFALISARERELAQEAGISMNEKPFFGDQERSAHVVPLDKIRRNRKDQTPDEED